MTNSSAAAASRQKSCNSCVLGKRKCDKTRPACDRCTARGVRCVYGGGRRPRSELSQHTAAIPSPANHDAGVNLGPDFESFDLDPIYRDTYDVAMVDEMDPGGFVPSSFSPGTLFRSLLDSSVSDQQLVLSCSQQIFSGLDEVTTAGKPFVREDYAKINPICVCQVVQSTA